ncbi:unnamed protein product, partial [Enterobius vermicularis]|uniref:Cytochrome b5 heme-binding domain-containing protein n=1 Tax=Enterobius vermicularis TaxID=51028 RepID=A0A0N4USG2_ENTVE
YYLTISAFFQNSYINSFLEATTNLFAFGEEETENEKHYRSKSLRNKVGSGGSKLDVLKEDLHSLPVFTSEQLALFDGSRPSKGVYLALLGRVYNVEKGRKHYAPGGGYHFFAGRDATRAFVTGDFSESGLVDDVSELGPRDLIGILDWVNFYEKGYELIGVVRGKYYDQSGRPTHQLQKVIGLMEDAMHWQQLQTKEAEIFPPCNSEYHSSVGGRVWCSSKSGGVNRDWIGVPRKLFSAASKTFRCVCVKDFGPPLSSYPNADEKGGRGDLDNPNLSEYPGCKPTSNSCKLDKT